MEEKDFQQLYIDKLNSEILSRIDFEKLDRSCNFGSNGYAVEVLKELHETFVGVYGTDDLDCEHGFTCVPAVLRGRTGGRLAVGLVLLDLESAGEHYGSYFFTQHGVIDDGADDNTPKASAYLKQHFVPYDYWYTVYIQRDHHVDFDNVPGKVADILDQVYTELQQGMEMK